MVGDSERGWDTAFPRLSLRWALWPPSKCAEVLGGYRSRASRVVLHPSWWWPSDQAELLLYEYILLRRSLSLHDCGRLKDGILEYMVRGQRLQISC